MAPRDMARGPWPLPVFGLTGSIAAGKSSLGRALVRMGAALIDADRLGHEQLWKGRPAHRMVLEAFGPSILNRHGGIDRARLGDRVFSDQRARARLERILHPAILAAAERRIARVASDRFCIVLFEAALLFESGFHALMDGTIVVTAARAVQEARLVERRGLSPAQARRRIRAQWGGDRKARGASWVIRNDGSLAVLEREAGRLYRKLWRHPRTRALALASGIELPRGR